MKIITTKEKIYSLRKLGWTYLRIGEKLGYTKMRIWQIKNMPTNPKNCALCNKIINFKRGSKYCLPCRNSIVNFKGRDRTREIVRLRDKHTCQDCNKKWIKGNRRFDVHHLNGLCGKLSRAVDKIESIDGLITLCHKCHFNRPEHKSNKKISILKKYTPIEFVGFYE